MLCVLLMLLAGMAGSALGEQTPTRINPPSHWPTSEKIKATIYEENRIKTFYSRY